MGQTALTITYHGESGDKELPFLAGPTPLTLLCTKHPLRPLSSMGNRGLNALQGRVQAVCQQRLKMLLHLMLLMLSQYRSLMLLLKHLVEHRMRLFNDILIELHLDRCSPITETSKQTDKL